MLRVVEVDFRRVVTSWRMGRISEGGKEGVLGVDVEVDILRFGFGDCGWRRTRD